MVVLINGNTASASEIVSGSLKDNKRATLIGEKTFGTGTVLQQFNLADGSAMLIGTQEWLTPNGQFIRDQGIKPDIQVVLGDKESILTPNDENNQGLSEKQILSNNDPQLIQAINYLKAH
jgi:carboxyl-terminal processing protease